MFCVKQSILCVCILSTAILVSWLCRGGRESVLFGDTGSKETTEEAQRKGEDEEERAGQGMCVGDNSFSYELCMRRPAIRLF